MTKEDIIRMAEEAGMTRDGDMWYSNGKGDMDVEHKHLVKFAALVAAHEREKVAQWMMAQGYATGHGDTIEDLLTELDWQVRERERKELERELLKLKQGVASISDYIQGRWDLIGEFQDVILARGKK